MILQQKTEVVADTPFIATSPITEPTWIDVGLKPGFRDRNLANHWLSRGLIMQC